MVLKFKVIFPLKINVIHINSVVHSMRCVKSGKNFPKLLNSEFIAPNATIIGDVTTGKYSSIYFGCNLRGDTCKITIGNKTIIQDNTQIVNNDLDDSEVNIGDRVVIGVNCNIEGGVKIEDNSVISNGATLHKGVHLSSGAMVAAGAVVPPGTHIPSGQIFAGNPAKYLRDLKPEEIETLRENSYELRELSSVLVDETEKTHYEIINDKIYRNVRFELPIDEQYMNEVKTLTFYFDRNFKDDHMLEGGTEGLGDFDNEELQRWTVGHDMFGKEDLDLHYEQDMTNYPDSNNV
jgi:carbonic anhydrase/acetyltransferase-like protein (isoleucine patch superfamily)